MDAFFSVAALYRFAPLEGLEALRAKLLAFAAEHGIKGTLILAQEGINGTVSAPSREALEGLLTFLGETEPALAGLEAKWSEAGAEPFRRFKARIKREIVTMGVPGIDAARDAGETVEPAEWNRLVSDPETVVIDTRNAYEVALGTFPGALDPATESFREFPGWAEANRERLAGKRVAMFCTGGIRCEKATAFVKGLGVEEVYHLHGGILRYLEEVPADQSLWSGECFVFDERAGLGVGLVQGEATLCRACGRALTPQDRLSPDYREGVSCGACVGEHSDADRLRFAERQRQSEG
ncbi:MAG: hypothetical protein DI629_13360 [Mesorhizobium amorphae]|nr:MAG: hypothetical protein DI629_13360 [Mesorhizobium amorphae]